MSGQTGQPGAPMQAGQLSMGPGTQQPGALAYGLGQGPNALQMMGGQQQAQGPYPNGFSANGPMGFGPYPGGYRAGPGGPLAGGMGQPIGDPRQAGGFFGMPSGLQQPRMGFGGPNGNMGLIPGMRGGNIRQ